jgi:hypothetical protein
MRAADSTRTDGSARISHSEFAIDKQRIVGGLERVPIVVEIVQQLRIVA